MSLGKDERERNSNGAESSKKSQHLQKGRPRGGTGEAGKGAVPFKLQRSSGNCPCLPWVDGGVRSSKGEKSQKDFPQRGKDVLVSMPLRMAFTLASESRKGAKKRRS